MASRGVWDHKKAAQWLADVHEDLEVRRWTVSYPAHTQFRQVLDEAARRAASLARLENALMQFVDGDVRHLSGRPTRPQKTPLE
jgi:acyl carrier protein phosphodiesterase